jgi:alkaline phosphatase D
VLFNLCAIRWLTCSDNSYDYRRRYATYRTDIDLLESHQNFPWISVWDDHEVENNVWKAGTSYMNNTEDSFVRDGGVSVDAKKAHAVRAHFEWMPIRQVCSASARSYFEFRG